MDLTDYTQVVIDDLRESKLTKQEQISLYATKQRMIREMFGGSISDVPINHTEYWTLDKKIQILSRMTL